MTDFPILSCLGLHKTFGGVSVTHDVSFDVNNNEIHALIGPNGAGKSTLLSQICGSLRPDQGQVILQGKDVTNLLTYERARLGLSRSFQMTSVFSDLSVLENLMLAVQAHSSHSFLFWKNVFDDRNLIQEAESLLSMVCLSGRKRIKAGILSYGERRQLDIAMALVGDPALLLLDEPFSGVGCGESSDLLGLLRFLSAGRAVLLVEHDMRAVFALADQVSVLVRGQLIATGSPGEVLSNRLVKDLYLGEASFDA
ncbi:MAG: ABC transporter ATP-binding protein [Alphaproteobacteria bacterium]|nr:ABC transporter ATP-binding protein [Alphaproteobacteria bacterium]